MGTLSVVAKDKKGFTKTVVGKNMISLTIPDSVTVIEDGAFGNCHSLVSATIPNGVKSIGKSAFYECKKLISVTMPEGMTSIGESAFYGCKSLESVTIPDSVTSIGDSAFRWCASLKSITIPDSVTSIGDSAFSWCASLKSITIPDSVTSIGDSAFSWCASLKSITIPDSVKSIGEWSFKGCTSLKSITIPDSVTIIGECAFSECTSLESITIPNSVISIEDEAFGGCKNLKSVIIPGSVTTIGEDVFWGCTKLESLIGVPGSYAEKWAEENNIPFITQNSISNKTQKVEPSPQPSVILREKSLVPQRAGENAEAMLKEFSEIGNAVSVSHSQKLIPFQESMKLGVHHITEGVQRIEVMNMWSVDIPTGYEFSLDSAYTGKSIGGDNRPLVIMIDNEYSDFLYPYQSEINFVVFATRGVEFHGQPLNSSDSLGIISEINEDVRRSMRKYKAMVETELINVQYLIITNKKEDSEFFISIFTQEAVFFAQFIFNEPGLEKDEQIKMVEDWIRTIKPITNGYNVQKNKGGRPNECGDNTTRTLTRNTSVEKANDTTDNFFEETVNTLNELRVIGDNLDEAGIGVKALFDIPARTRDLINMELGEFLLYLAHVNGDITDLEAALLYIVMGDHQDCDKNSLSQLAATLEEPKPDNLYSLGAFLGADIFLNLSRGTNNTRTTDRLIQLYKLMATIIIATCDQRSNLVAEKKKMKFLNGMETYVRKNL